MLGLGKRAKKAVMPSKGIQEANAITPDLMAHAVDTFGSERKALNWFSVECGDLKNQSPLSVILSGNHSEVERILDCIDHGMLA
jgi:uncharacterized protein (DUF2384 family)